MRPADTTASLLPPQATEMERDIEQVMARMANVPTPMGDIWDHDTCPAHLLGFLAWGLGVDEWDPTWSEQTQREAVRIAPLLSQRKGTVWSLQNALNQFGVGAQVKEWWATTPMGAPGTFEVITELNEESYATIGPALTPQLFDQLERVVDSNKPVSRSYKISVAITMLASLQVANYFSGAQALSTEGALKPFEISNFETSLSMGGVFTPSQSVNSSGVLSPLGVAANTAVQLPSFFGLANSISTSGTLQ